MQRVWDSTALAHNFAVGPCVSFGLHNEYRPSLSGIHCLASMLAPWGYPMDAIVSSGQPLSWMDPFNSLRTFLSRRSKFHM